MKAIILINLFFIVCYLPLTGQQIENQTNMAYGQQVKVAGINSDRFVEFAPSVSADGKTMIFESDREKGWKLFETKLDDKGNWSDPIGIENINTYGRRNDLIGGPSLSYDGNHLYFFGFFLTESESEDIWVSLRDAEGWKEPVKLDAPVNSDGYEGFPSISPDDNTLYFIRVNDEYPEDSISSEPCFVIYSTTKNDSSQWAEPKALPAPVNMGCEREPKIMADGKTLIFSSIREGGMGQYDLYQTHMLENGEWAEPIHLDYVNTSVNDLSPSISASGDDMFFFNEDDIYKVRIPPKYRQYNNITVEGYVSSKKQSTPLLCDIFIKDKDSGQVISHYKNNGSDGWYSIVLTEGIHYELTFSHEDHISRTLDYDLKEIENYREEHVEVELTDELNIRFSLIDEELAFPVSADIKVYDSLHNQLHEFGLSESFESTFNYKNKYIIGLTGEHIEDKEIEFDFNGNLNAFYNEQVIRVEPKKIAVLLDVVDINNSSKVRSKMVFKNKSRNETIEVYSDEMVSLRSGDRYQVSSEAEGYLFSTEEIEVNQIIEGVSANEDGVFTSNYQIPVSIIEENASLVLQGVHFESNSSVLTLDSKEELDRIIQLMLNNPNITIEIGAHSDDVGNNEYNKALSLKRAQSVLQYLVDSNIPIQSLVANGYGEEQPAVPNTSDENRAKNRRVELRIIKVNQ